MYDLCPIRAARKGVICCGAKKAGPFICRSEIAIIVFHLTGLKRLALSRIMTE